MADPFVAEIRMFPFNFAPRGWAWCDGQILPLSQNTALFSLLGTTYGGDGKSNFALPNLQARAPLGMNDYPYPLGDSGGSETVTLIESELPAHGHQISTAGVGSQVDPTNNLWGTLSGRTPPPRFSSAAGDVTMYPGALAFQGGSQPHNNMQPYLTVYFCIALQGVYPPRT